METSSSDSVFVVQDGDCTGEESGTPPSDPASFFGPDLQSQRTEGDKVLKGGEEEERSSITSE